MPSSKLRGSAANPSVEDTIRRVLQEPDVVKVLADAVAACIETKVLNRVEEALSEFKTLNEELRKQLNEKDSEIEQLRLSLEQVRTSSKEEIICRTDDLEQYQRRDNLRVFGVPETEGEDTDHLIMDVARKVGEDIQLIDISRSHRVGPKTGQKPRPIIVKFVSYRDRSRLFHSKRKLKGSGITIREDLTTCRLSILRAAVELHGLRNVWTNDCAIIIRKPDGSKVRATRMEHITL